MSADRIRQSVEAVIKHLTEHPEEARSIDRAATAVVEKDMRCRVEHPSGIVFSDMGTALGGGATAPSPGWLLRAAQASCDATMIALRAAQLGVTLKRVEVTVDSESDDRGLLGMDDSIPAGPLSSRTHIRVVADGQQAKVLREIIEWAEAHSPVSGAIRRAIPSKVDLEIE